MRNITLTILILIIVGVTTPNPAKTQAFRLGTAQSGTIGSAISVKFNWQPMFAARSYTIVVARDPKFEQIVVKSKVEDTVYTLNGLEGLTKFYWKVSAVSAKGATIWNIGGIDSFTTPMVMLPSKAVIPGGKAVIDGVISPGEWDNAVRMPLVYYGLLSSNDLQEAPVMKAMWDGNAIYFIFQASTINGNAPKVSVTEHDGQVWIDDGFEVFLKPEKSDIYYQFILNWKGTRYEGKGMDATFTCDWQAASTINGNSVIAEAAIPWAGIGAKPKIGSKWGANFSADFDNQVLIRTWSKPGILLHDVSTFGTLVFGK